MSFALAPHFVYQRKIIPLPRSARRTRSKKPYRHFRNGRLGRRRSDPEVIDFGVHATFGPIFRRGVNFRPGVEVGIGDIDAIFGVNLYVLYTFAGYTRQTRWNPLRWWRTELLVRHKGFSSDQVSATSSTTTVTASGATTTTTN